MPGQDMSARQEEGRRAPPSRDGQTNNALDRDTGHEQISALVPNSVILQILNPRERAVSRREQETVSATAHMSESEP